MTPAEAQMLLGIAASYDNRKPNEEAAIAWAAALDEFEFIACREAVVEHYRESREWIMPADIVGRVRHKITERFRNFGTLIPPEEVRDDYELERKWRIWAREEIGSGRATCPGDIGMDDGIGYPKRDVHALLGIPADDVRGLRNPRPVGALITETDPVLDDDRSAGAALLASIRERREAMTTEETDA
jgi:hypothetical protein